MQIEELKNILDKQEYKRLLRLANVVLGNQNMNGALTLASWVAFCWQALGGPGIYHKDVERADVEQVFLLLEKLAPYGQVDLDELQQKLEALYAAADDVAPAVEVMTIHKSKGLEFESVILYGLHKQPKSDTLPLLSYEISPTGLVVGPIVVGGRRKENAASAVANYLFEREKIRNEQEIRRLLYVALTRARSSLHLVANLQYHVDKAQRRSPSKGTLLAVLWPLIENSVSEPTQAESEQQKNQSNRLSLELEQSGNRLWRIADTAWCESQLNADRKQQLENRLDVGAQWHWESAGHNESAVGQVAHAWLEHIARDGLHKWPIKRVQSLVLPIERQLRRAGCSRNYVPTAVKEVMQALIKTLESEKGQWLLEVAKAQREWSLLDYQGRVSIIDLAIDQQDHWLVVDYKTSVPRPDEPMEHFILRMRMHHEEQLARYCAQVTALDGRPAKAALYFPRIDYWYELKLVAG